MIAAAGVEEQRIMVLIVAAEGLDLLARGLRRNGRACELCTYAPDVVRYYLRTWHELVSAVEGCPASGTNPIGGGIRDRMKLAVILADLEAGTDVALEPLLHWQAAARIFKRQARFKRYTELRYNALLNACSREPEPSFPLAEARCIEEIARTLGWLPHQVCEGNK
jgi:hypothetical protein